MPLLNLPLKHLLKITLNLKMRDRTFSTTPLSLPPNGDFNAYKVHTKYIPRCAMHAKFTLRSTYKEVMAVRYQEIIVIYVNDLAYLVLNMALWGIPP